MTIDISTISRVVGVTVEFKIFESGAVTFLPQRIALLAQGASTETYIDTPVIVTSSAEVAALVGFGSPAHLCARQLFPDNGDGVGSIPVTLYPMQDDGAGAPAAGDITGVGTQVGAATYLVKCSEIPSLNITVPALATAAEAMALFKIGINGVLNTPIIAGTLAVATLPMTAKWDGLTGNDIFIEIEGVEDGIVFTVTQPTGGLTNSDVDTPLAKIIDVWETCVINTMTYDDQAVNEKYELWGKGRWADTVKKPALVFSGTIDDRATRTAVTDAAARKNDYINCLIPALASNELPFVIAARAVSRIAKKAQNLPGNANYGQLTGLVAGPAASQENLTNRDLSAKAGSGTTIIVNGDIELNDTITMYHPDGEVLPGYRYVSAIMILMNIIFNIRLIFESDEWKGAPLMPAGKVTTRSDVKSPSQALTAMGNLANNLQLNALISDASFTQANMTSVINSQNNNRLDNVFPVKIPGTTEIIDVLIPFGWFFPTALAA